MKKVLFFLILLFPIIVFAEEPIEKELIDAQLIKCETANYAYFNINNNKQFIRLLAFDRMSGALNNDIDNYVCTKLKNASQIQIEYDPNANKDQYNRTYAFIYVDGILLQEDLIKKGYGQVSNIQNNYNYLDKLCNVQKDAIINKLGIWNYPNITEEYCKSGININNKTKENNNKNNNEEKKDYSYLYQLILISSAILLIILILKRKKCR